MNTDSLLTIIDSLQQVAAPIKDTVYIINSTPIDTTNYFSWFLAFTTLMAVIIAPFVQNKIAKKQIHATTVTSNRREWINMMRDAIAEFTNTAYDAFLVRDNLLKNKIASDLFSKTALLNSNIELLLIHVEGDTKPLLKLMDKLLFLISEAKNNEHTSAKEFTDIEDKIIVAAKKILKEEWKRVIDGK